MKILSKPISSLLLKIIVTATIVQILGTTAYAAKVCEGLDTGIPDNSATGVTRSFSITRTDIIQDLDVLIDIDHNFIGDLEVSLKHVDTGTTVKLVNRPSDGTGTCGANNYNNTVLNDEGTEGSVQDPANCINNSTSKHYVPAESLSAFDGETIKGTWELVIKDLAAGITGTYRDGCLIWNATDIELTNSVSIKPVPGTSNFFITFTIKNNGPYKATDVAFTHHISPTTIGASFENVIVSQGSVGVSGLPFAPIIIAYIGEINVGAVATVTVELIAHGFPMTPLPKSLTLMTNSPEALDYSFFTFPIAHDPATHPDGVTGDVVLVQDGDNSGGTGTVNDACQSLTNASEVNGNIALVDARVPFGPPIFPPTPPPPPAPCSFVDQINNAIAAGAIGVLLTSNYDMMFFPIPTPPFHTTTVPVGSISKTAHQKIIDQLNNGTVNVTLQPIYPKQWWNATPTLGSLFGNPNELADTTPNNNNSAPMLAYSYDMDQDNAADAIERCMNDAIKTLPGQCGCSTPDTDNDGDGVANCNDNCPDDSGKIAPGVCGCGTADNDSDGDGTLDCNDQCPQDAAKTAPGTCGCGTVDKDTDGDGTLDCQDNCPEDSTKTEPGLCGCGIAEVDSNSDGIIDCNLTQGFKSLAENAKSLLEQLVSSKKKSKSVRDQLKNLKGQLLSIAKANANSIQTLDASSNVTKLTKKAKKKIEKALQAKKKKFKGVRNKAIKAIEKLIAALA